MRKLATLTGVLGAVVATLALAGSASAASISIVGSNAPGTNTYDIVLSFTTGEAVAGFAVSTTTDGTYTGAFTESTPVAFSIPLPGPGPIAVGTGIRGSWGASSFGPQVGGTFTIGTIEITVGAGNTIDPFFTLADGVVTTSGTSIATTLTGVTIIPEPTTASLLGLGIAGLVLAGRRRRA
jgi:hypothetical protein